MALPLSAHGQAQSQNPLAAKNVLILHAFESNVPIFELTDHGIRVALGGGGVGIRNQFYEYLDLARNPGPEYRKHLVELMRLRYGQRKIDAIITLYPEALQFALNEGRTIFSEAPIIALYLPIGLEQPEPGRRVIQHPVILDFAGTLEIALKPVPKAKRVYVVSGIHPLDRSLEDSARQDFKKWEGRLEFRYLSDLPMKEILATVSRTPPGSIVFVIALTNDVTGRIYTIKEVTQELGRVSNAPVFGLLDVLLGQGIVGGSLLSYEHVGTRAGELTLDILRGTRAPENIPPILDVPPVPMFDWRQLKRWNLSEADLPEGSIVINRETTFWDFKYYILGGLALMIGQSLLIAGLEIQRRRRRSAEESLRQKTKELDQFFSLTLDLLCIAKTEGYFLRLNPAWERILGYSREELTGRRFFDFVHPDDLAGTREAVSRLASQRELIHFENRYRCKDGTYRWLEWTSAPAGELIYAAARDATVRKQAEEVLRERLQFEHLLAGLSARFVNMPPDQVDSEIEDGLKQILAFFQVDRCGLLRLWLDKTSFQITHIASSDNFPPVPEGVELPGSLYPWTYQKLAENNEVLSVSRLDDLPAEANVDRQTCIEWGIRSYVNIPIMVGESINHIISVNSVKRERVWPEELFQRLRLLGEIFVNALMRKEAEAEASNARSELLRVERLLQMGELTTSLAHEISQPLTAILSNAEAAKRFLSQASPDISEVRQILEDIIRDDRRASQVIQKVRALVRKEKPRQEFLNLNDVIREIVALIRGESLLQGLSIAMELAPDLQMTRGDRIQLQQVILNLILNSAAAMRTTPSGQRKMIVRTAMQDSGTVRASVTDFGTGIDANNIDRLFEPFYTTKPEGLGMGLSISQTIINAHGGAMEAWNNREGGATFAFTLPADQGNRS